MICCGYDGVNRPPKFDPSSANLAAGESLGSQIAGVNTCGGYTEYVDSYYPTWWVDDPRVISMAPASYGRYVTGLALGSTAIKVSTDALPGGEDGADVERPNQCPLLTNTSTGNRNVVATVTNFRETYAGDNGGGVLHFEYRWDSKRGT